jgi:hypothetical protein
VIVGDLIARRPGFSRTSSVSRQSIVLAYWTAVGAGKVHEHGVTLTWRLDSLPDKAEQ